MKFICLINECLGASIYGLGAGRFLPNFHQAYKLSDTYHQILKSNTATFGGTADHPGGYGMHT